MIRKKFLIIYSILVLNCLVFIGCSEQNKTLNQVQLDESIQTDSQFDTKDKNITISSDIAKLILIIIDLILYH